MIKLTKTVPSKLQLDGWWLDHPTRPLPKRVVVVKMSVPEAKV